MKKILSCLLLIQNMWTATANNPNELELRTQINSNTNIITQYNKNSDDILTTSSSKILENKKYNFLEMSFDISAMVLMLLNVWYIMNNYINSKVFNTLLDSYTYKVSNFLVPCNNNACFNINGVVSCINALCNKNYECIDKPFRGLMDPESPPLDCTPQACCSTNIGCFQQAFTKTSDIYQHVTEYLEENEQQPLALFMAIGLLIFLGISRMHHSAPSTVNNIISFFISVFSLGWGILGLIGDAGDIEGINNNLTGSKNSPNITIIYILSIAVAVILQMTSISNIVQKKIMGTTQKHNTLNEEKI